MTNLALMLEQQDRLDDAVALLRDARKWAQAAGRKGEAAIQADRMDSLLRRLGRDAEADAIVR